MGRRTPGVHLQFQDPDHCRHVIVWDSERARFRHALRREAEARHIRVDDKHPRNPQRRRKPVLH